MDRRADTSRRGDSVVARGVCPEAVPQTHLPHPYTSLPVGEGTGVRV